jgi:hypothetical protein
MENVQNKSPCYSIFTIQQLIQKLGQYNLETHLLLFTDSEMASKKNHWIKILNHITNAVYGLHQNNIACHKQI